MNLFSWLLYWEFNKDLLEKTDLNVFLLNDKLIYVNWFTKLSSSKEVVEFFGNNYFEKLIQYDISIDIEDKIFVNNFILEDFLDKRKVSLNYIQIRFIWKSFDSILKEWKNKAISIREAEYVFWIRSIKVDLIN